MRRLTQSPAARVFLLALALVAGALLEREFSTGYALMPAASAQTAPLLQDVNFLRWSWLKGTTWYVPAQNPLGVVLTNARTITPVLDQTVYQISDYRQGFFWGKLVKKLTGSKPSCSSIVGSVTPEGWIQMSLVPHNHDNSTDVLVSRGMGIMRLTREGWTMEWQGASGPDDATQYSHWAYMTQTRPGLPSWNKLPFVNMSVEEFLAQCPEDGPGLVEQR